MHRAMALNLGDIKFQGTSVKATQPQFANKEAKEVPGSANRHCALQSISEKAATEQDPTTLVGTKLRDSGEEGNILGDGGPAETPNLLCPNRLSRLSPVLP